LRAKRLTQQHHTSQAQVAVQPATLQKEPAQFERYADKQERRAEPDLDGKVVGEQPPSRHREGRHHGQAGQQVLLITYAWWLTS
jgi:hypothetical protein